MEQGGPVVSERQEESLYVVQPFRCVAVGKKPEVDLVVQVDGSQLKKGFVPTSRKRDRGEGENDRPAAGRQSGRRTRRASFSVPSSSSSSSSSSASESRSDQSEYNVSDYSADEGEEEEADDQPVSSGEMREEGLSGSGDGASSDVSQNDTDENIAVVDAFKRVSPVLRNSIVPIVVTSKEALHSPDDGDTTSATMSLESTDDKEEHQSARKDAVDTAMLDALALAVEQVVSADAHKEKKRVRKPKAVAAPNKGSPLSTWYAGYDVACGMGYIYSTIRKGFVQPDPLYEDPPERWRHVSWTPDMLPQFTHQDTLRGSIEYLKYAARRVGNLYDPPANVQRTVVDQFQQYESILSNISDMKLWQAHKAAGDARRRRKSTKKPKMESPLIFSPRIDLNGLASASQAMVHGMSRRSTAVVEGDPAARTDVRWGSTYQVTVPPKKKDASLIDGRREKRLGGTLVAASGTIHPPKRQDIDRATLNGMTRVERAGKIMEESKKLIDAVGSLADMLGLKKMGAHMVDALTAEEQEAFGNGMTKHGKNFKRIRDEFLPHVSCRLMAAYYYDVWKLQLVPAAVKWYQDRDEERSRQEEILRDEMVRKAEMKDASSKKRLVKDSIMWVKDAARSPSATNFNRQVIRDRVERAASCRKASQ